MLRGSWQVVTAPVAAARELLRLVCAGRRFIRDMADAAEYDLETARMACRTNGDLDDWLAQ